MRKKKVEEWKSEKVEEYKCGNVKECDKRRGNGELGKGGNDVRRDRCGTSRHSEHLMGKVQKRGEIL
jgi:hypothetical protein